MGKLAGLTEIWGVIRGQGGLRTLDTSAEGRRWNSERPDLGHSERACD